MRETKRTDKEDFGKRKTPTPRSLKLPPEHAVRSHLEKDRKDVCAYCGREFLRGEVAIEKEINGRRWRFCGEEHLRDFMDAVHFRDQDLDGYEREGNVTVGEGESEEEL